MFAAHFNSSKKVCGTPTLYIIGQIHYRSLLYNLAAHYCAPAQWLRTTALDTHLSYVSAYLKITSKIKYFDDEIHFGLPLQNSFHKISKMCQHSPKEQSLSPLSPHLGESPGGHFWISPGLL